MKTKIWNWLKKNWIDVTVAVSILAVAITVFFIRGAIVSACKGVMNHWAYSLCVLTILAVWLGRRHTWPAIKKAGRWTFGKTSLGGRWVRRKFVSVDWKGKLLILGIGIVVLAIIALPIYLGVSFITGATDISDSLWFPVALATLKGVALAIPLVLLLTLLIVLRRIMGKSLGPTVEEATEWMRSTKVVITILSLIVVVSIASIWVLKTEWVKGSIDWTVAHKYWVAISLAVIGFILWFALKGKGGGLGGSFDILKWAKALAPIGIVGAVIFSVVQCSKHSERADEIARIEAGKTKTPERTPTRVEEFPITVSPGVETKWFEIRTGGEGWHNPKIILYRFGKQVGGEIVPTSSWRQNRPEENTQIQVGWVQFKGFEQPTTVLFKRIQ